MQLPFFKMKETIQRCIVYGIKQYLFSFTCYIRDLLEIGHQMIFYTRNVVKYYSNLEKYNFNNQKVS